MLTVLARALLSRLSWVVALTLIAPLALGVSPPQQALELPEVVVRGIDQVRLEAQREGVLPLEPPRLAQTAIRMDMPVDVLPAPGLREAPVVVSPGCAYRNRVTGALARATNEPEPLYKSAMERLSRNQLDEATRFLVQLRDRHPAHPLSDDAAFWLAEINRRKGSPDKALEFLRLVRGSYAREAAYRLAWLLETEGRTEEARGAWADIARDAGNPHRPEALYRVGVDQLTTGDPQQAVAALREVLELDTVAVPADVRVSALLALGLALRKAGDARGSEQALVRFLLESPDHPAAPAAQVALAWTLLEQEKPREAALRFDWVIAASPPHEIAARALYGRVRAGADMRDDAATEKALAALEAARPPGPWVGWARADLGWLAFQERLYADALQWYRSAVKGWEGPGSDVPRYMAAECLYQLGRYLEASRAYRELAPQSPFRAPSLHRAGVCELLSGNPAPAVKLFQAILDHHPGYPEADRVWAWLGEALFRLGRMDDASLAFRTVPDNSPAQSQALYGRAWIAFETQRWEEAAQLFGRFLAASPDDPNRAEAMLALARAHFNRRELRPALEALDRLEAQTTSPNYLSGARFYRGWMLTRSGSKAEGREILQSLLTDEAKGLYAPRAQQALAWLDYSQGDFESALARFIALIDLASGTELEREARQKRADCLYNLGRHKQALEAYRSLGDTPEARHGEALCLYRLGRPAELARVAEEFASRYPGDPRATDLFFSLAQARSDAGDPTGAANAYRKAARMSKDGSRAAEARLEAARSLVLAGKPEAALTSLKQLANRRDAVGLAALREQARLLENHGTLVQAREAWDRLAERTTGEERTQALRAAARWARASLDWVGARQRLETALAACPTEAVHLRQELLADLGELLLLEGRPVEAALSLTEAAEMGTSPGGLRAFLSLARAQEAAGQKQEALESILRIGYLYSVHEAEVAQALLRAAELLETQDKVVQARALYEKVAAEGPAEWAEQARDRLAKLPAPSAP